MVEEGGRDRANSRADLPLPRADRPFSGKRAPTYSSDGFSFRLTGSENKHAFQETTNKLVQLLTPLLTPSEHHYELKIITKTPKISFGTATDTFSQNFPRFQEPKPAPDRT